MSSVFIVTSNTEDTETQRSQRRPSSVHFLSSRRCGTIFPNGPRTTSNQQQPEGTSAQTWVAADPSGRPDESKPGSATDRRAQPAHSLPGSALSKHFWMLVGSHGDVHAGRRYLHASLRFLRRWQRATGLTRSGRAASRCGSSQSPEPRSCSDHFSESWRSARRRGSALGRND